MRSCSVIPIRESRGNRSIPGRVLPAIHRTVSVSIGRLYGDCHSRLASYGSTYINWTWAHLKDRPAVLLTAAIGRTASTSSRDDTLDKCHGQSGARGANHPCDNEHYKGDHTHRRPPRLDDDRSLSNACDPPIRHAMHAAAHNPTVPVCDRPQKTRHGGASSYIAAACSRSASARSRPR